MGFGVGGIVPQFVSDEVSAPVNFMFRPRNVYKNAKVVVAVDDTVIYSKKSMILAPGEMVNVKIDPEKLTGVANAKAINVRIEVPEA